MTPVRAQSNDVLNRINRLENEINTLNRAVYKGEPPPAPAVGATSASGGAETAFEGRLNQMESDLRTLTDKVEKQTYDVQQLQQQVEAMQQQQAQQQAQAAQTPPPAAMPPQPNAMTMEDDVPPSLQPDLSAKEEADTAVTGAETGDMDAAGLYEQGFGEIKSGDYAAAEKSFATFMKKYPTHALAPNALYWLGETYYVRKDYDKATRAFAEAYQKFPDGPKAADNLLKLGMSLAAKGEKDNACVALAQLKKQYPNGPAPVLKRGDDEMSSLGCPQ